jgi:ATP synthase protein I
LALRRGPTTRYTAAGRGAEIAWEFAVGLALGAVLGIWIDGKAGTSPLFLVVFLALGMTVGVRRLLRFARSQTKAFAEQESVAKPGEDADPERDRDPD